MFVPPPSGFEPNSVTFISLEMGWALGAAPCPSSGTCLALRRTLNAGRTWTAVAAPPTLFSPADSEGRGVSQIRFADPLDGWAFGPDLWSTHDGGAHWTKSGFSLVWALEAAEGRVDAVNLVTATGAYSIESSLTTKDSWVQTGSLQLGAGPVPAPDLVLQGAVGWAVENDRTVVDAARLGSGHWAAWPGPCANNGGTALPTW